jgi:hypothetical protein
MKYEAEAELGWKTNRVTSAGTAQYLRGSQEELLRAWRLQLRFNLPASWAVVNGGYNSFEDGIETRRVRSVSHLQGLFGMAVH